MPRPASPRWKFETGGEIVSSANFAGDRVVFGSYDSTLYCLTADGKLAWKFKTQGPVQRRPRDRRQTDLRRWLRQ